MSTLDSQNSQGPLQGLAPGTGSSTLRGALVGLVPPRQAFSHSSKLH